MHRVYNFSAGPAVLPEEVLREAADEMLDYQGTGMSVMEMSHRSAAFDEIIKTAEQDLRDLMGIPDNYKVPPGRCLSAVCSSSHEPHEERRSRLYRYRSVGKESLPGSKNVWGCSRSSIFSR